MKNYLVVGIFVLASASALYWSISSSSNKETPYTELVRQRLKKNNAKPIEVKPDEVEYDAPIWKVVKTVPEFETHLTEKDKRDYLDHLDFMVEEAFIQFITDSTYVGNNGIIDMTGTYKIEGKTLKTTNDYGFKYDYQIVEYNDETLIYKSVQDDLTVTLYHQKIH